MVKFNGKSISIIAAATAVAISGTAGAATLHKTVSVNVDGQSKQVSGFITGKTVAEILSSNGIQVSPHDNIQPGMDTKVADGMNIVVSHARKVKVQDGNNEPKEMVTLATTWDELLKQSGIQLGQYDKANVDLQSTPGSDQTIVITRRDIKVEVAEEKIPFQTERQPDDQMLKGQERVLSRGVEGSAKITTTITFENGAEVDRQVQKEVVKDAEKAVVAFGSKQPEVILASRSGAPSAPAVGSAPSSSTILYMSATAYVGGGRTATGRTATYGVAAVDPNVIPLGTKLYIDGYGYAIAADTGGAIKGNKIDLVFNSQQEALAFGRRQVTVKILD